MEIWGADIITLELQFIPEGGVTMDLQAIGARIKAAREANGMTQEDFAAALDLSRNHISVIERGVKAPKLETFVAIANVLGVSADALLFDVIDHASDSVSSELSDSIAKLPKADQNRIVNAIKALLEK